MDVEEVLELTAKIWDKTVDTGSKEFSVLDMGLADALVHDCPCCDFSYVRVKKRGILNCKVCPMLSVWGLYDPEYPPSSDPKLCTETYIACESNPASPYFGYGAAKHEYDKEFFALLISESARELLHADS